MLTDDAESEPAALDNEYRERQSHEDVYREIKHGLAGDKLPKAYHLLRERNGKGKNRKTVGTKQMKKDIHLVGWIKGLGFNLIKDFGTALGGKYAKMNVSTLVRKFIARPGTLHIKGQELWVTLEPFKDQEALKPWLESLNHQNLSMPWLGNLLLRINIAKQASRNSSKNNQVEGTNFCQFGGGKCCLGKLVCHRG